MDNIVKAKAILILDQPFFASLLLGMDIVEDNTVPTMATDGDKIYYNKKFMNSLTVSEVLFALSHEVLHAVFQHMCRKGTRHHKKWNHACDYVINELLIEEKIGTPIKGILVNSQLVKDGNGTAEGVYNLLPEFPNGNDSMPGAGEANGPLDDVRDAGQDEATMNQKEAELKVKVAQAANAAKMCGKLSNGLERLVKSVVKSKVDWRFVLRKFFTERTKDYYTYAKPKRKFLADDIYLPGLTGESLGAIAIAVDCSGSIQDDTLRIFSQEIEGIIEDTKPKEVHVFYFDSQVTGHDTFTQDDTFQINARGGGGTAFSPVFNAVQEKGLDVKAMIFLTDLECNDFGNEPQYPVLWVSISRDEAPFGTVIKLTK